jgi:hypothetical protein
MLNGLLTVYGLGAALVFAAGWWTLRRDLQPIAFVLIALLWPVLALRLLWDWLTRSKN